MADGVTVKVEGARELERVLRQLPPQVARKVVRGALMAGALPILKEARARAPVRKADPTSHSSIKALSGTKGRLPGFLRASLRRAVKKEIGSDGRMVVGVGALRAAYYWMFQEFGTRFHAAQPFLRPAFDSRAAQALGIVGQKLGDGIEKEAARLAGRGPARRRRR